MKCFLNLSKVLRFNSLRNYSVNNYYDVCIVGGGPVGFGFASLLSSHKNLRSCRVLLLESGKHRPFVMNEEFSNRTVALSPRTRDILRECGAWKVLDEHRYNTVKRMFIWEQTSDSFITFQQDDTQHDLAYIVENDLLQHAIVATLSKQGNVEVRYGTTVSEILIPSKECVIVSLADGTQIHTSLLVGADGYMSRVREQAGIKSHVRKYDQNAIVSVVKFQPDNNDSQIAWQRFTRNGPIAYLPLDSSHCNLIWSTTTQEANRLMKLDEESFINELNFEMFSDEYRYKKLEFIENATEKIVTKLRPDNTDHSSHRQLPPKAVGIVPKSRATFPLGYMHATNYVARNVALIGDSAHRILPLAGQGVNLGFGDAEALARCISEGVSIGEEIGDYKRLQEYETERQRYVLPVAATIQTLHHLYFSKSYTVVVARSVGLKLANLLKPFKKLFVNSATKGEIDVYTSFLK